MRCGACCAQDGKDSLEFDSPAQSDAVLVDAKPFDQEPAPKGTADFMGKKVQPMPEVDDAKLTAAFKVPIPMQKDQYPGFLLDVSGGPYLRVCKIERYGPIAEYHERAPEDRHVRVGDFVTGVNNISGDSEKMILALGAGGDMELEVRRAFEISVQGLDKRGGSLGLDLSYRASSMSVVIKEVYSDGEVAKWNNRVQEAETRICANDHIIAVNGKNGTSRQLVQAINESQKLDLLITRPSSSTDPL